MTTTSALPSPYARWLDVARRAAEEAGAAVKARWRHPHAIHWKGWRDIVTETDTLAETIILGQLRRAFPQHAITSEEEGASGAAPVRWYVDPLDGTTNFSRDNPNFCIAIGAVEGDEPVVGVIHDPLRGQTFAACLGGGATLNGEPLHVSSVERVEEAILYVGFPRDPVLRRRMLGYVGELLPRVRALRALGSAALGMVYVAAGWVDVALHLSVKAWDHVAAAAIVREAGGIAATCSGAPWMPTAPDPLMVATPALLDICAVYGAGEVDDG